jgi:hypothetical protein
MKKEIEKVCYIVLVLDIISSTFIKFMALKYVLSKNLICGALNFMQNISQYF